MGYAVKLGKLNDGKQQLSYFTFLPGNGMKQDTIPKWKNGTPFIDVDGKRKTPIIAHTGFFTLPFDYCIGGYIMFDADNRDLIFATKPKTDDKYYLDPRGKKWYNAFQTTLSGTKIREKQDLNTPAEVAYKWSSLNNGRNNADYYERYIEYVNYFSICNTSGNLLTLKDGYLFGFRNREYFRIHYDPSEITLKATSSEVYSYYITVTIPCIIETNVCDTMYTRVTQNVHLDSRNIPWQNGVNYNIIANDGKKIIDVNQYYTEFTDFNVPSSVLGPKYVEAGKTYYTADNDHYGTTTYRWNPTATGTISGNFRFDNYAYLNDHVAKTELNLSIRVFDTDGRELKPAAGDQIGLDFDFLIFKKNLMGNNITNTRHSANIKINGTYVVN